MWIPPNGEDDSTIIGGVAVEGHPMKLSFESRE